VLSNAFFICQIPTIFFRAPTASEIAAEVLQRITIVGTPKKSTIFALGFILIILKN
jgi:hypothetical protein